MKLDKSTVLALIRHLLTFAGGGLTAQGWATDDEVGQLVGALATVVGIVWSIIDKRSRMTGGGSGGSSGGGGGAGAGIGGNGSGAGAVPVAGCLLAGWLLVGCGTVAPGHDALVVRAEQTTVVAFEMIDTFLKWEFEHRDVAGDDVKAVADTLRARAPLAIQSARLATKAYKANRTDDNKASLMTALAVLESFESVAANYLRAQVQSQSQSP